MINKAARGQTEKKRMPKHLCISWAVTGTFSKYSVKVVNKRHVLNSCYARSASYIADDNTTIEMPIINS